MNPDYVNMTLRDAQLFVNKHLDNANRILKKPSWTEGMQKMWAKAWQMIDEHKKLLASGNFIDTRNNKVTAMKRGLTAAGHFLKDKTAKLVIL